MKTRVSLRYFVNDCTFSGAFSKDNLPRTKYGAYVIYLNDKTRYKNALRFIIY